MTPAAGPAPFAIHFTPRGARELTALPKEAQRRICEKLHSNASLPDPLVRAAPLVHLPPSTHRFRVGKYRISFSVSGKIIFIERVELRGSAYRR